MPPGIFAQSDENVQPEAISWHLSPVADSDYTAQSIAKPQAVFLIPNP